MIGLGKKNISVGDGSSTGTKSIVTGGGSSIIKDGYSNTIDVSESVTVFGFSLDFTPMFRELVTTFGWEETP